MHLYYIYLSTSIDISLIFFLHTHMTKCGLYIVSSHIKVYIKSYLLVSYETKYVSWYNKCNNTASKSVSGQHFCF